MSFMLSSSFKLPKNTDKISWTKHSIEKMKFYGLSPQRVLRILKSPARCEEAVAPGCVACMQTVGNKRKTEIWMMYTNNRQQTTNNKQPIINNVTQTFRSEKKKKIITAWRYPGVSPVRGKIPIPEDILEEVIKII